MRAHAPARRRQTMQSAMRRAGRIALLAACALALPQAIGAQTLASYQLGSGWATFGLALPSGAAPAAVAVGTLPTQTDVKTRWPDGSIRFAVVTAQIPSAGTYAITAAAAASGSFAPAVPNASVRLTIGGTAYTARVPAASADRWLAGPLVQEWRATIVPTTSSGAAHAFVRVLLDTRVYNDGRARLDVTVENVLDVAGATAVTYTVDVLHNTTTIFTKANVSHPWLTRWRKTFPVGGLALSAITPDFEPVMAARAVPRYLTTVNNTVESPAGASFEILGVGSLNPSMPSPGGRPEIAPYPDWAARYVVHRNPTQRQFVLAHGDLAGSWPIHIRESDGRLVSIDERPNFWLDGRCEKDGISCPRGNLAARGSLQPDRAHQPSLAFVPYLLTGDRYYADEMAYWANYEFLDTWPPERQGSRGLLNYYEIRGFAWSMRNLGDATAYLPDADPRKAFFAAKLANNLGWADDYADGRVTTGRYGQPLHPLGISFYYTDGTSLRTGEWENHYLAWTLDHLTDMGFVGGTRLRDRIARLFLKGFTTEPEFPRSCAIYYRPTVGTPPANFYSTWSQFAQQGACRDTRDMAEGHWGLWSRPMLLIAMKQGWAGSTDAYNYMMSYSSAAGTVLQRANEFAGWALAPGGTAVPPPPPPAPGTTLTVTFDDLAGSGQTLPSDYPAGVLRWEPSRWFHSGPFGGFTTKSVSFNGTGISSATVTILSDHRLVQLRAYNGGTASTIAVSCAGQSTKQITLAAGELRAIDTGWTANCGGPVTISSTNGWDTNFDDFVLQQATAAETLQHVTPADTMAPVVSLVQASAITKTSATISWITDEASDSVVEYGTTGTYGSMVSNGARQTSHSLTLIDLVAGTTYQYRVLSRDAAGNVATSANQTFTTEAATPLAAPKNLRIVSP